MGITEIVTLILYDSQRRVLLQKAEEANRFGNKWGFLCTDVEEGKSSRDTLSEMARGMLGQDLSNCQFLGRYGSVVENHVYAAREPIFACLKQGEGSEIRRFPIQDIARLEIDYFDCKVLKHFADYLNEKG